MDLMTIIDNLDDCYPHFCSTLPSSGIISFTPTANISVPATISSDTDLFIQTNSEDSFRLVTNQKLHVFPFEIQSYTVDSLTLYCYSKHFTWLAKKPLSLRLTEFSEAHIHYLAELATKKISLKVNDQYVPVIIQFATIKPSTHPYELLNNFCNLPYHFLVLELYIEDDLILTSQQLQLYFNQPMYHFSESIDLHINSVPVFNTIKTRSEPIRILNTRLEYPIIPEVQLSASYLKLCTEKVNFFLAADFVTANHQSIISLPITCHQHNLYQSVTTGKVLFYQKSHDTISSINLISRLRPPIYPVFKLQFLIVLTILDFDYITKQDHTKQLKDFLKLHNRQSLASINQLIESIYAVNLTPIHINTLNYNLQFSTTHPLQPFLLHVLHYFFEKHRPINTHIKVSYALPTL